jgi:hypothetical protein
MAHGLALIRFENRFVTLASLGNYFRLKYLYQLEAMGSTGAELP